MIQKLSSADEHLAKYGMLSESYLAATVIMLELELGGSLQNIETVLFQTI